MKIIHFHKNLLSLIEEAKRGNRRAQQQIFNRFAPKMLGVCRRYFNQLEFAEEVMLAGFFKVFTKLDTFSAEGSFEGWIRRIMVNECISELRKEAKFQIADEVVLENISDYTIEMDTDFAVESIQEEIDFLPEGYRIVFVLYVIEGYKHHEIASKLNISVNTSKTQLFKARKMLQKKLENLNYQPYEQI